jgi:hypothetical protein
MTRLFSKEMVKSIDDRLFEARQKRLMLDVYRTAESIRVQHESDNVALEDIIAHIVRNIGSNVAAEFVSEWTSKFQQKSTDSHPEFMMSVDEAHKA